MTLTALLHLVPRLRMSETQLTLNVPYGSARRQPYFYVDYTGSKHQYCLTASRLLLLHVYCSSLVMDTDTNITVQLHCQFRRVIIYFQGRIPTPWSNTS